MEDALIFHRTQRLEKVCEVIQTVILIFLYKVKFRKKLRSLVRSRHAFLNTIEMYRRAGAIAQRKIADEPFAVEITSRRY